MRLVAAARVRRAQEAVLKTRPLIAQLQLVFKLLLPEKLICFLLHYCIAGI